MMLCEDDQFADNSSDDGLAPSQLYAGPGTAAAFPPDQAKIPAVPPPTSRLTHHIPAQKSPVIDLLQNVDDSSGNEKKPASMKEKIHIAKKKQTPIAKKEKNPKAKKKTKPTKKERSPEKPVVAAVSKPDAMIIPVSSVETQVCKAARLVAQELVYGGWPEVKTGARHQAAVALEEFARTVFLPNMLQESREGASDRVFLATMLALREVLTQNADRIFYIEKQIGGELQDDAPGGGRRKVRCQEEERQYMAQLFATGVVFAAFQSLTRKESEAYTLQFSKMMDSYDMGHDDFASCMKPLDGRHQGVQPNMSLLDSTENVVWKMSYNRAREAHPVLRRSRHRREVERLRGLGLPSTSEPYTVEVPTPNAVLVSMVEKLSPG
jgi:hypothetical protein